MNTRTIQYLTVVTLTFAAAAPTLAQGSEPSPVLASEDGWRFKLTPYFWLGGMDGSVTKGPVTANISQDLGDVIDLLSDTFNAGAALHFEAATERWGVFADAMYLDLRAEGVGPVNGQVIDAEFQQFLGELGGFYSVAKAPRDPHATWVPSLDVLAGLRVYSMETELTPVGGTAREAGQTWFDPIIGIRGEVKAAEWLAVFGRGDIGGFGLDKGTVSNFSWNLEAGLRFDFSRTVGLSLGYRWLDVDYEDPSENFTYDVRMSGPFTALEIRF